MTQHSRPMCSDPGAIDALDRRRSARRASEGTALACLTSILTFASAIGFASEPIPEPRELPLTSPVVVPAAPASTPTPPTAESSAGTADPFSSAAINLPVAGAALPTTVAAGRSPVNFGVTNSGAATYTIPVWTPPGIGSVELKLSLVYNSRESNGVLGQGWSLSGLSAITRCNRTLAQDGSPAAVTNTLADRFCLDGQQLKLVSGSYGAPGSVYATELESFSRVVAAGAVGAGPASFTVTTKNGLVYDYGTTTNSQVYAGTSGTIRGWALAKIRDRAGVSTGNAIAVAYTNEAQSGAYTSGTYRVASITYPTSATGQGPFYRVRFSYSPRPATDVVVGYLGGSLVREVNKLDAITIEDYTTAATIKSYNLGYEQGSATNRLRLASVTECSASSCLRPTLIGYQNGQAGWATAATTLGPSAADANRILPIDLNGDGISDLVYPIAAGGNYSWYVVYGSAAGTFGAAVATGVSTPTNRALVPGDFATKGQTDLLYPSGGYWYRLFWSGTGLSTVSTGALVSTAPGFVSAGATAADVNGDGRPDLVWYYNEPSVGGGDSSVYVQLNTTVPGAAVTFDPTPVAWYTLSGDAQTSWSFLAALGPVSFWSMSRSINVADFNGDGRADILVHLKKAVSDCPPQSPSPSAAGDDAATSESGLNSTTACGTTYTYFWRPLVSTGSAFAQAASYARTVESIQFGFIDWNGDGCTDLYGPNIVGGTFQIHAALCSAAGAFGAPLDTGVTWSNIVMAGDYDGDGRQDLLNAGGSGSTWKVIRSTGDGIGASAVDTGIAVASGAWFISDLNGDGLVDLGWSDQANNNKLKVNPRTSPNVWPDLATGFTDGFGMAQNPTYIATARGNYTKHADAVYPESDYAGALYVVSQFTASDGTGSTYQNQFHYYGARIHVQGRGFEGFYAQRIYDTRNGLYTFDYVQRAFPYTGLQTQRSVWQGNLTTRVSEWTAIPGYQVLGATGYEQRVFPYTASVADSRYELGGSLNGTLIGQSSTYYTYADGYGNPTQVQSTVTDKDPYSPFLNAVWQSTINTTFANSTGSNCLGLPTLTARTESAPGQTTQTRTTAYTVDSGSCRTTQQVLEPNTPALKVTTTLGFDGCGNVNSLQVVGANPSGSAMPARTTTFNHGTRCQLPETVTNALGQATTFAYSYDFGVPTQSVDPNGLLTAWQYDEFGRRTLETRADGTQTAWAFDSCSTGPCWGVNDLRFLVYETPMGSDGTPVRQREYFYDGYERLRYDEYNRVLGTWTYEIFQYDSLSRRTAQYLPYASASNGYRTWTYDALNRVTSQRLHQPSGTVDRMTTLGYAGRTTTITDPLGHARTQVQDVLGRLRRSTDPSPGGTSAYDYDSFGNLNRIQDPIGAVSTGTYNLRGFRTQWADADRGTWNFSGNSLNERVSWTDAKGQSFSEAYDPLGRLTSRTEPEGTSNWTWGNSATSDNIGRLKSVSGYGYAESLTYDSYARLQKRTITTDQSYQYNYTYNSIGAIDTISYPTSPVPSGQTGPRLKVQYGYSYGEPTQITDITQTTTKTLWTLNTANDFGSATSETLGPNLLTVSSGYKAWTNELTSRQAGVTPATSNRQNLAYQWDTVGNLTQRQDLTQSLTEAFTPDALDRLASSTLNGAGNLTVGYDAAGNITSKSDVGAYSYGSSAHPHAVTAAGSHTFSYDANGNQITRDGSAQAWASFNLPTTLAQPVAGTTYQSQFSYGPDHQRWKQVATYSNGTETTYYAGALLEKEIATSTGGTYWRHYVPTPSGMTVVVSRSAGQPGQVTYALTDSLGSSDALLDEAGNYRARESFAAFGARRGSNWSAGTAPDWLGIANSTRHGYTGHEHLDNTGLIHMNGRTYDPLLGRFMSVDPLIGDLTDSQSVNPYTYVDNRPLTFTDPSGLSADGGGGGSHVGINTQRNDGSPGTWKWWSNVFESIGDVFTSSSPPPPGMTLPGQTAQGGSGLCGPGTFSPTCGGMILYAGVPGGDSGVPSSSWVTSADANVADKSDLAGEPGDRAASVGLILARDPNIPTSIKLGAPLVVAIGIGGALFCISDAPLCELIIASVEVASAPSSDIPLIRGGVVRPNLGSAARAGAQALPKLQRIHSLETLTKGSAKYSYDSIRKMSTDDIVKSLRPGSSNPLTVKPDGRIFEGNTRILVLEERGFDINSLPRVILGD